MTTCVTAVRSPPGGDLAVENPSQLVAELRDAAQTGLRLALQGAERITKVVKEYCVEFEQPMALATARIAR
ncbi:MAG: hypothetical protein C0481_16095 [Phenylobacterium sp.]|uniref:hypothetical protein n=1 Tax=Phenylobacterium sp. TaxID=1871053 RepID=UPI0025F4FAAB|nr:hypothetical protein [Phenylobacterium sp.]MBA4013387.1 hypothetical protein [Phenylobacterium sp.]